MEFPYGSPICRNRYRNRNRNRNRNRTVPDRTRWVKKGGVRCGSRRRTQPKLARAVRFDNGNSSELTECGECFGFGGGEDSFRHHKSCHLPQRWRLIEKKCGFLKLYILCIYKSLTVSNALLIV